MKGGEKDSFWAADGTGYGHGLEEKLKRKRRKEKAEEGKKRKTGKSFSKIIREEQGRNRSGLIFSHLRILYICLVLFYFQSYLTSS